MSVVKDVDLEAMPTSIFLNDDEEEEDMCKSLLVFPCKNVLFLRHC